MSIDDIEYYTNHITSMIKEINNHIYTEKELNYNSVHNIVLTMRLEEDLEAFVKTTIKGLDRIVSDYSNRYGLIADKSLKERLAKVNNNE